MGLRSLKQVLLAKVEAEYGVDSLPTGGINAMLASSVRHSPLVQEMLERKNISPRFGSNGKVEGSRQFDIEFDIELAGSGVPGNPPAWAPLLLACGMREEVEEGVSVSYLPDTEGSHSITLHFSVDGVRYAMAGGRGNCSLKLAAKSIPLLSFKFTGMPHPVLDMSLPAPDLSGFVPPLAVTESNTGPVSLHGFSGSFSEISLDLGNSVYRRNLMGSDSVLITDRSVRGSAILEMPRVSQKDFFAIAGTGFTGPLSLTHGTASGNIVKVDCPAVQVAEPQLSSSDNIEMLQLALDCLPESGDDEIRIRVM
ncbi:MAG: phage tail tube protein [Burkholderiales bacterium]